MYPKGEKMKTENKFVEILNHRRKLLEKHSSLGTTIAQLTAAGCINATEYWKDDKYLYLLRPMNNGKRLKTYVGNHQLRIQEARQKVINYKKRLSLIYKQEEIEKEIGKIERVADDLYEISIQSQNMPEFD